MFLICLHRIVCVGFAHLIRRSCGARAVAKEFDAFFNSIFFFVAPSLESTHSLFPYSAELKNVNERRGCEMAEKNKAEDHFFVPHLISFAQRKKKKKLLNCRSRRNLVVASLSSLLFPLALSTHSMSFLCLSLRSRSSKSCFFSLEEKAGGPLCFLFLLCRRRRRLSRSFAHPSQTSTPSFVVLPLPLHLKLSNAHHCVQHALSSPPEPVSRRLRDSNFWGRESSVVVFVFVVVVSHTLFSLFFFFSFVFPSTSWGTSFLLPLSRFAHEMGSRLDVKHERTLRALLKLPDNRRCADCDTLVREKKTRERASMMVHFDVHRAAVFFFFLSFLRVSLVTFSLFVSLLRTRERQ